MPSPFLAKDPEAPGAGGLHSSWVVWGVVTKHVTPHAKEGEARPGREGEPRSKGGTGPKAAGRALPTRSSLAHRGVEGATDDPEAEERVGFRGTGLPGLPSSRPALGLGEALSVSPRLRLQTTQCLLLRLMGRQQRKEGQGRAEWALTTTSRVQLAAAAAGTWPPGGNCCPRPGQGGAGWRQEAGWGRGSSELWARVPRAPAEGRP